MKGGVVRILHSILILPLLCPLFQDPDIESLIKRLGDESIDVREKATTALVALGGKVEEKLKLRLGSAQGEQKSRIELVLQTIRRQRNLAAVLPPVKKITLEGKEKSFRELAKEFQRQTGWPLDLEGGPDRKVTLSISDAPPFEALDALCRSAETGFRIEESTGFEPKPKDPNVESFIRGVGICFSRDAQDLGPRNYIRQYSVRLAGVALTKVNDFKAHTSEGFLSVHLMWPPTVKPQSIQEFRVVSIQEDGKQELYDPKVDFPDLGKAMDSMFMGPDGRSLVVHFKHPSPDAKKLVIKGRASFTYPVDEEVVTFANPKESLGQRMSFDGMEILFKEFTQDKDSVKATFDVFGKRNRPTVDFNWGGFGRGQGMNGIDTRHVRMKTRGGEAFHDLGGGVWEGPKLYRVTMQYTGVKSEVTAFEFMMDTVYHTDSFQFEFKDIDLPK
jgi:hypothetical protein